MGTTETNAHNFYLENKQPQMITAELPSKYHTKFEHFLWQRKTIAVVKYIFLSIEDKHFKIECSAIENTFVN